MVVRRPTCCSWRVPSAAILAARTCSSLELMLARAAISWLQKVVTPCNTLRRTPSTVIRSALLRSTAWRTREVVRPPLKSGTVPLTVAVTPR